MKQSEQPSSLFSASFENQIRRNFQLVEEHQVKQLQYCYAIAFNKESTLMIAGCGSLIKVFQFSQGVLKEKQVLGNIEGVGNILALYCMQQSNQLISGESSGKLKIWSEDNMMNWICIQEINEAHQYSVLCVIANIKENLVISISGSADKTIKFWIKKNYWEHQQTLEGHTSTVWSLSLNDSQNQLVSCDDNQILISKQDIDEKWRIVQCLQQKINGRVCFINDNMIAFQPFNSTQLNIFAQHPETGEFLHKSAITVPNGNDCTSLFPQYFNKTYQMLICKNGDQVNILKLQEGEFILDQSIKFNSEILYGAITSNGQSLVTWDDATKKFQIWIYM